MLVWDEDCEQAFQLLKKALVQAPVMAYPTRDEPFILSMNASDNGMGTVPEQEQEEYEWSGDYCLRLQDPKH